MPFLVLTKPNYGVNVVSQVRKTTPRRCTPNTNTTGHANWGFPAIAPVRAKFSHCSAQHSELVFPRMPLLRGKSEERYSLTLRLLVVSVTVPRRPLAQAAQSSRVWLPVPTTKCAGLLKRLLKTSTFLSAPNCRAGVNGRSKAVRQQNLTAMALPCQ